MSEVIDTNVVVRYLVGDNPQHQAEAIRWFKEAADGHRDLLLTPMVVAECCYVLESFYKRSRSDIAASLEIFICQEWLRVEQRDILLLVWKYYLERFHFVDSYLLAMQSYFGHSILTFDEKLSSYQENG